MQHADILSHSVVGAGFPAASPGLGCALETMPVWRRRGVDLIRGDGSSIL